MSEKENNQIADMDNYHVRWKELYIVGGICGIVTSILVVLTVVVYFIRPFQPGLSSAVDIFSAIQNNAFQGLMSLDFTMVVSTFIIIPFFLAIYISTKLANESYALIALTFGLISCILAFFMRPVLEMFYFYDLYTKATTEAARNHYLTAAEALGALNYGTCWVLYMISFSIELVLSSLLMLRIKAFNKATAWLGIILTLGVVSALGPIFPELAQISTLINLVCTLIWTIWNILVAKTLFQLAKSTPKKPV